MITKHFIVFLSLFVLTFVNLFASQEYLDSGTQKFFNSDYTGASIDFKKAAQSSENKAEAYLMLSLTTWRERDFQNAFEYIRKFFELSDNPEPYISALWVEFMVTNDIASLGEEFVDFMEEIYESDKISRRMKINALENIRKYYDELGDFEKANSYSEKIRSIDKWQLVGDFENISGSGFDKEWEPIKHPESEFQFKARTNAPVKWFELKYNRPGFWIRMNHHFYVQNAITFAQTFCNSPKNIDAQIRIGTSGSIKVWVNDKIVISESEERNNGADTYIATIKLNKGANRLLIQLGESELRGNCNFFARITNENGDNIEDLIYKAEFSKYAKPAEYTSNLIRNDAEVYFEDLIKNQPDQFINYIFLAHQYMQNDKNLEARKVINKAIDIAPNCSYIQWQLVQLYLREDNRTALSMTLEKMKSEDPHNPLSLSLLFNEALDNKNYDEAESLLTKLTSGNQNSLLSYTNKIKLASAKREIEKINSLVDNAYELYPYHTEFVIYKYIIVKEIKKNPEQAAEYLKDFLDERFDSEVLEAYVSYLFTANRLNDGIELMKRRIESDPTIPSFYKAIGKIYAGISNYEKAIEWYNKSRELAPYVGSYLAAIGDAYKELNKTQDAIKAYEECILYSPTYFKIRNDIRLLKNEEELYELIGKPDLYNKYLSAPDALDYPEDNSIIVHDETQVIVYETGGYEEKHYELMKVFNSSGIDDWKEYYIPVYENQDLIIEKAEVLKKDGNKLKAEISENYIVFTNLEVGDGILIIYKLETYQFGTLIDHFWSKSYFSTYWPIKNSSYKLLAAPGKKFDYVMLNSDLKPTITKNNDYDYYVWEVNDIDAIRPETLMPGFSDISAVLALSTIPDWNYISMWYDDISRTKAKPEYEVKELISELFPNGNKLSDLEKVKKIYDYIVNNIRYSSVSFRQSGYVPQKASKVINTKVGDCKDVSTLMVSMCSELGIDANLVLVDTRDNGQQDLPLPTIDFNHCIAKVNIDKRDYYVELTTDYNSFSTIFMDNKGASALDISSDTSKKRDLFYLNPHTRLPNSVVRKSEVSFENENMFVEKNTISKGGRATITRYSYRDIGVEQRRKSMQEAINNDYSNIKLVDLKFDDNLNTTDDSLTYFYTFGVKNVFSTITDLYLMKLPWSEIQQPLDFLNHETRKYPIELWTYKDIDFEFEEMSINIPSGMEVVEIPKKVEIENDYAKYLMEFQLQGKTIQAKRLYTQKKDVVPPSNFLQLKEFIEKIIKSDSKQIAFRKMKK